SRVHVRVNRHRLLAFAQFRRELGIVNRVIYHRILGRRMGPRIQEKDHQHQNGEDSTQTVLMSGDYFPEGRKSRAEKETAGKGAPDGREKRFIRIRIEFDRNDDKPRKDTPGYSSAFQYS